MTVRTTEAEDPAPERVEGQVVDDDRAGRRSEHGSSSDAWENRDRAVALLHTDTERRVVSPMVLAQQAKEMEQAFQALCANILTDDDYALYVVQTQTLVNGQIRNAPTVVKRKRKSAWRKLARYFNVDVQIDREVIGHRHNDQCGRILYAKNGLELPAGEDCGCPTVYARYHVRVIAPNGRTGYGVGVASLHERDFKAQDHSIPATAYTRAISRGISDMIASGEGEADDPAETKDAGDGEPRAEPASTVERLTPEQIAAIGPITDAQKAAYEAAWTASSADRRRNAIAYLQARGFQPGQFGAHGADDFAVVMTKLGAVPDEAPM